MKQLIRLLFTLFLFLLVKISTGQTAVKIQQWQPYDFEFKNGDTSSNPFTINFSAEALGPGRKKLVLPGFYDGNGIWKIRFAPTKEGTWSITTMSDIQELNEKHVTVKCIKNKNKNIHGNLLVDPVNKQHFIYEDGTRWFPNGYEANWLWALDEKDNSLPTLNPFLDKIKWYGFNFVLINAYAYDTKWRAGKTEAEDYGPPLLYPWGGNNKEPDFTRYNIEYWIHYDKMIEALYQRGIIAHIYLKVYNKEVNWMKNNSPEDDQYFRWMIARYAAYPNITWDLAKEANYEKSIAYKTDRLKFIRNNDPYKRLLTVHTDIKTYDAGAYNELVDFRSHQEQTTHLHETTLKQLKQNLWPVMNVESGYEYGPKGPTDKTYNHVHSPEEVARFYWEIQMAGGYNAYYYTHTAWDVMRVNDNPPGYGYLKNFSDFFRQTKYWLLQPADSLMSSGYCLANTGKEYVIYQKEATAFTVNFTGLSTPLKGRWFQPLTGKYLSAGKVVNGRMEFIPPPAFKKGPVVLYVN